ncbi:hypothetical protein NDU88_003261 [Pleurodeles waltl]|uniref:Uncharacterized protein n=1 Tax=Pleurodeles waltl TaxID=8319 RepID=A0AAV7SD68_PLEWA|nr:hypothetical protein NDU88_003261 [Pleurodeles waltl]
MAGIGVPAPRALGRRLARPRTTTEETRWSTRSGSGPGTRPGGGGGLQDDVVVTLDSPLRALPVFLEEVEAFSVVSGYWVNLSKSQALSLALRGRRRNKLARRYPFTWQEDAQGGVRDLQRGTDQLKKETVSGRLSPETPCRERDTGGRHKENRGGADGESCEEAHTEVDHEQEGEETSGQPRCQNEENESGTKNEELPEAWYEDW